MITDAHPDAGDEPIGDFDDDQSDGAPALTDQEEVEAYEDEVAP